MSSEAEGLALDMDAVMDPSSSSDTGVPSGAELLAFVDAVENDHGGIDRARNALCAAVGQDGMLEAAGTIAIFNGLIRVADGTGIQLDAGLEAASVGDRSNFGIDEFEGSGNTPPTSASSREQAEIAKIQDLFG